MEVETKKVCRTIGQPLNALFEQLAYNKLKAFERLTIEDRLKVLRRLNKHNSNLIEYYENLISGANHGDKERKSGG
jgi:hypothetical protein